MIRSFSSRHFFSISASSAESIPNMARFWRSAGFVVPRRWRGGLGGPRSHVDRLLGARILARELPRRLVAPLLLVTMTLVIVFVGHALFEALEALGDVSHHVGEAIAAKQQQDDDREDQDMPNAETTHGGTP